MVDLINQLSAHYIAGCNRCAGRTFTMIPTHSPLSRRHLLAALGGLAAAPLASAQTYPSKPIRVLIGVPAGGTQDVLTRAIADAVRTTLGPIIIDNRGGAAGRIAVEVVKSPQHHLHRRRRPGLRRPGLLRRPRRALRPGLARCWTALARWRPAAEVTQGYSNSPVCSPTRFALMTGRYQYRLRGAAEEPINSKSRGSTTLGLPPEHPTLPSLLRAMATARR
jgi:hypothetical protein